MKIKFNEANNDGGINFNEYGSTRFSCIVSDAVTEMSVIKNSPKEIKRVAFG